MVFLERHHIGPGAAAGVVRSGPQRILPSECWRTGMKKIKIRRLWLSSAALLLAAGHWFYWYHPHPRSATPNLDDLPARLLLTEDFPTAVWVPFPHQNLGALSRLGTSPQDLAAALAGLAEVEAPSLPRFGPFSAPPARELLLAADPEGGRFLLAARVYPGLAVFARLAGRMAGNPWLGGGTIELRKSRVEIRWDATLWSARTVGESEPPLPARRDVPVPQHLRQILGRPSLSLARIGDQRGFLPDGWYRLSAQGRQRHLERLPSEASPGALQELSGKNLDDFFLQPLLSESVALVAVRDRGLDERQALALFDSEANAGNTGFALLSASPARQLPLAGLGLAVLLGDQGYSGIASGWSLLATSELNFRQGAFLVPPVREGLEGHLKRGEPLELALAGRPQAVLQVLRALTDRLGKLGAVAHSERVRLLALQDLLRPLTGYAEVRLAVASDRQKARLELNP